MAGTFQVNYNAGGVVDEVKKIKLVEDVDKVDVVVNVENVDTVGEVKEVDNVKSVDLVDEVKLVDEVGVVDEVKVVDDVKLVDEVKVVDEVKLLDEVKLVDEVGVVDEVKKVDDVALVDDVKLVDEVKIVDEIGKIRGFATKTQPYNTMEKFDIPALYKDPMTMHDFEFTITLPSSDVEIMAMSLTCSGYGENDHYDLYVNGVKWFDNWYCSEVREGLFIGTSTYVYAAPPSSNIKLVFKNESGTAKTLWFGVRMLV
jgi:hypothetical protein